MLFIIWHHSCFILLAFGIIDVLGSIVLFMSHCSYMLNFSSPFLFLLHVFISISIFLSPLHFSSGAVVVFSLLNPCFLFIVDVAVWLIFVDSGLQKNSRVKKHHNMCFVSSESFSLSNLRRSGSAWLKPIACILLTIFNWSISPSTFDTGTWIILSPSLSVKQSCLPLKRAPPFFKWLLLPLFSRIAETNWECPENVKWRRRSNASNWSWSSGISKRLIYAPVPAFKNIVLSFFF